MHWAWSWPASGTGGPNTKAPADVPIAEAIWVARRTSEAAKATMSWRSRERNTFNLIPTMQRLASRRPPSAATAPRDPAYACMSLGASCATLSVALQLFGPLVSFCGQWVACVPCNNRLHRTTLAFTWLHTWPPRPPEASKTTPRGPQRPPRTASWQEPRVRTFNVRTGPASGHLMSGRCPVVSRRHLGPQEPPNSADPGGLRPL